MALQLILNAGSKDANSIKDQIPARHVKYIHKKMQSINSRFMKYIPDTAKPTK